MTAPAERVPPRILEALSWAQRLAFGPVLFQALVVLRDRGILGLLIREADRGLTPVEVAEATGTSKYGVTVLLEGAVAAGAVETDGERFWPTRVGVLIERDALTRVNMDFVRDVVYRPAASLGTSIEEGRPAGLGELGPWPDIYQGLAELAPRARESWLRFDHFFSDEAFPLVLEMVLSKRPRSVLDIGGNTGKFATAVLNADPDVVVTIADLPGQIETSRAALAAKGLIDRVRFSPIDVLDSTAALPGGHDVVWMSQFLSCFDEQQMELVLRRVRQVLSSSARLFILDNLWDQQKNEVAKISLLATSLYFTCVANGRSRIYDSKTLFEAIDRAGLVRERVEHAIGWGHSLIECRAVP